MTITQSFIHYSTPIEDYHHRFGELSPVYTLDETLRINLRDLETSKLFQEDIFKEMKLFQDRIIFCSVVMWPLTKLLSSQMIFNLIYIRNSVHFMLYRESFWRTEIETLH